MKKVILTIVVLSLLTSTIFFGYSYFKKDEETANKTNQENQTNINGQKEENNQCSITEESELNTEATIVRKLIDTFEIKECEDLQLASKLYTKSKLTTEKMSSDQLVFYILKYYDAMIPVCSQNETITLSKEQIQDAINILFGQSIKYSDLKLDSTTNVSYYNIKYNSNAESITVSNSNCDGCGPGINPYYLTHIANAKIIDDQIIIEQQIAYLDFKEVSGNDIIYNTYTNADKNQKVESIINEDLKNWQLYDTYKYIFELENGYYVLKSIEYLEK